MIQLDRTTNRTPSLHHRSLWWPV